MTTQNRQNDSYGSDVIPSVPAETPIAAETGLTVNGPHDGRRDWFQIVLYTMAAVAAAGLAVALLGVYVLDSLAVMVVGTLMVSGSAVVWVAGALFVIGSWLVRRSPRRSDDLPR